MSVDCGNFLRQGYKLFVFTALLVGLSLPLSAAAETPCRGVEIVVAGDTLSEIARRCHTTVAALKQANPGVEARDLRIGEKLFIPIGVEETTADATSNPPATSPATYIVRRGDSLIAIARRFNTTLQALLAANPRIVNPNLIRPGWELVIPGGVAPQAEVSQPDAAQEQAQAEAVQRTSTPTPASPTPSVPVLAVRVRASGFAPNESVEVGLGRTENDYAIVATVQANVQGEVATTVPLPKVAQAGEQWVLVLREQGTAVERLIRPFTIPGEPAAPTPTPSPVPTLAPTVTVISPTVLISPTVGPPGAMIQVDVHGFPADQRVTVELGEENDEPFQIVSARTDAGGALQIIVPVPLDLPPDIDLVLLVRGLDDTARRPLAAMFTVTGTATVTSTNSVTATNSVTNPAVVTSTNTATTTDPVTGTERVTRTSTVTSSGAVGDEAKEDLLVSSTRANLYLIAWEDGGQSGTLVGCGDSVVPVEVTIGPTISPLVATLQQLLDLDDRRLGEAELYNALSQSSLSIEHMSITNGRATIRLTGEWSVADSCDEARVIAQVEATALQFSTVKDVQILINGQSLSDASP